MSIPSVFLPEAMEDIALAFEWYELRRPGLGDRFKSALRKQIARIEDNPETYGTVWSEYRAAPLRRFPFVIYYRPENERVVVVAVQHGSREWKHWQSRT